MRCEAVVLGACVTDACAGVCAHDDAGADDDEGGVTVAVCDCIGCGDGAACIVLGRENTTPMAMPSAPTTATAAMTHGSFERVWTCGATMTTDALDSLAPAMSPAVD